MGFKLSHVVLRLASGASLLNSGVSKLSLDKETAETFQSMAGHAIPQVKQLTPETFGKALAAGEIALGAALLLPFVPSRLAGLALSGFAGGLVATYLKTPGLTEADGIRPTPAGIPMSKDIWLAAIGLALLVDRKHKKPAPAEALPRKAPKRIAAP